MATNLDTELIYAERRVRVVQRAKILLRGWRETGRMSYVCGIGTDPRFPTIRTASVEIDRHHPESHALILADNTEPVTRADKRAAKESR